MAASPLGGLVVMVRSGRVCQRPAGPLFVRKLAQIARLHEDLVLSLPPRSPYVRSRGPAEGAGQEPCPSHWACLAETHASASLSLTLGHYDWISATLQSRP